MTNTAATTADNSITRVGPGIQCDHNFPRCHAEAVVCVEVPAWLLASYLCPSHFEAAVPEVPLAGVGF